MVNYGFFEFFFADKTDEIIPRNFIIPPSNFSGKEKKRRKKK